MLFSVSNVLVSARGCLAMCGRGTVQRTKCQLSLRATCGFHDYTSMFTERRVGKVFKRSFPCSRLEQHERRLVDSRVTHFKVRGGPCIRRAVGRLGEHNCRATIIATATRSETIHCLRVIKFGRLFSRVVDTSVIGLKGPEPSICLCTYRGVKQGPRRYVTIRSSPGKMGTTCRTNYRIAVIPSLAPTSRRIGGVTSRIIPSLQKLLRCLGWPLGVEETSVQFPRCQHL